MTYFCVEGARNLDSIDHTFSWIKSLATVVFRVVTVHVPTDTHPPFAWLFSGWTWVSQITHRFSSTACPEGEPWSPVYTIQPVTKLVWQPVECLRTRYNRLSNRFDNRFYHVYKHSAGCQTGCTTQFDNSVERTATVRSTRLLNRLYNELDNRLYRVNKHPAGCRTGLTTGLTTGWMFVYTIQPVVKPQPVVSCKRGMSVQLVPVSYMPEVLPVTQPIVSKHTQPFCGHYTYQPMLVGTDS